MDDLFDQTTHRYLQALEDYPDVRHLAWLLGPKSACFMEAMYEATECIVSTCTAGSRVLDFGCATGLVTAQLHARGMRALGMDVVTHRGGVEQVWNAWRSLQPVFGARLCFYNGRDIPFADASFDGVVAHAVLEHVPPHDLPHVLCELYRIIRPGGHFFAFATPRPESYTEWIMRSAPGRVLKLNPHQILLDEDDLQRQLIGVGFEISEFKRTDLMFNQMPGPFQKALNACAPFVVKLDRLLLKTPLSRWAHHSWVVCEKP